MKPHFKRVGQGRDENKGLWRWEGTATKTSCKFGQIESESSAAYMSELDSMDGANCPKV